MISFFILAYLAVGALFLLVFLLCVAISGGWEETAGKLRVITNTEVNSLELQWVLVLSALLWPIQLWGLLRNTFSRDRIES